MEENLGVIEQALGIIFELRYSGFLNLWVLFCLGIVSYEFWDLDC